eukprot:403347623
MVKRVQKSLSKRINKEEDVNEVKEILNQQDINNSSLQTPIKHLKNFQNSENIQLQNSHNYQILNTRNVTPINKKSPDQKVSFDKFRSKSQQKSRVSQKLQRYLQDINQLNEVVQSDQNLLSALKQPNQSVYELKTDRFLRTNLQQYFNNDHVNCISCSQCIKSKDKNLFYKYPQNTKSNYEKEFGRNKSIEAGIKPEQFVLDKVRQSVKTPLRIKRDLKTTNQQHFLPFDVNQSQENLKSNHQHQIQVQHHSKDRNDIFIDQTTYRNTFQNWGVSPLYKQAQRKAHFIDMKLQNQTSYKLQYSNSKEAVPQFMIDHDYQHKREHRMRMMDGQLPFQNKAPQLGKSTSQATFVDKTKLGQASQVIRPIDELFVPTQLPMQLQTGTRCTKLVSTDRKL